MIIWLKIDERWILCNLQVNSKKVEIYDALIPELNKIDQKKLLLFIK